MNPTISVIIPVYKCEKHLSQCIESVLNQTFQDFELILVDDGSPDSSPRICDEYAQKDKRIQVIHKINGGVSSARNEGLKVAQGEYINFIDSDDYIDSEMLECLYKLAKEHLADIVVSGLIMEKWEDNQIIGSNVYKIKKNRIYTAKQLLEDWGKEFPAICMCGPWCKLYKNTIIKKYNVVFDINLNCGEDTYFNLDILENIDKIYFSEGIFYHYRRDNADSLFSRFHKNTYEIHSKVYGKMRALMMTFGCKKKAMNQFENQYFRFLIGGIREYFKFYNENTEQERLALIEKISLDANLKNYKLIDIKGFKNRILLFLLKARRYRTILTIFEKYYKK